MTKFCDREVKALSTTYLSFTLPPLPFGSEAIRFRKLDDILFAKNDGCPRYYIPVIPNLAAYDGIFWNGTSTFYLIQITIANKHTIKNEPVKIFFEWSKNKDPGIDINFVFIVPRRTYDLWTECQNLVGVNNKTLTSDKQVKDLKQFVLQMDIVEQ